VQFNFVAISTIAMMLQNETTDAQTVSFKVGGSVIDILLVAKSFSKGYLV
jgi:hypothetical protein